MLTVTYTLKNKSIKYFIYKQCHVLNYLINIEHLFEQFLPNYKNLGYTLIRKKYIKYN